MADYIEVGEELFIVASKISIIAEMYNQAMEMYDEGMKEFLNQDRGYLGKTNENLEKYKEGINGHLFNLVTYLQNSSLFVYSILEKFAAEDKKLAEALKAISIGGEQ